MTRHFQLHRELSLRVAAPAPVVFAHLDDHRRLAAHMEKPSLLMAGAAMTIQTDGQHGQGIGSMITIAGRVLGIPLSVRELVTVYDPPYRKVWETQGTPRLLLIGPYRMGFELTPGLGTTQLRVWIDYDAPSGAWGQSICMTMGRIYAAWCVRQIATDAATAIESTVPIRAAR